MKRMTVFLPLVVAVLALNCLFVASSNASKENISHNRAGNVTFTGKQLSDHHGINYYGTYIGKILDINTDPHSGKLNIFTNEGLSQENYGLAPAWGGHKNHLWDEKMLQSDQTLNSTLSYRNSKTGN